MKPIPHLVLGIALLVPCAPIAAETPLVGDPNFIATPAELKARIARQLHITKPDFVVFVPEVADSGVSDTGNEHFLVFDGPDGSLMAVWTQSSVENYLPDTPPDQHIAFARSTDEGMTWSRPRIIAGPRKAGDGHMASWGYPLVSKRGRVYVLYSQHIGKHDSFVHHTGWLHGIYSDDNGATWSKPQDIPVARSINDNPDPEMPPNMLCWQKPLRLGKDGKYLAGFTRWTSFAVREPIPLRNLASADSRVEFMRFENLDDSPEPADLKISWFAANEKALAVPFPKVPQNSVCQEPSIVKLPDGRLFCVMRTGAGSPFWSVSTDGGETWAEPRRLLRKDGGEPLLHPISPCPIYDVGGNEAGSGRYVLFIHDNDGNFKGYRPTPLVTGFNRRPVYLVPGRFQPGADQPVWFDDLKLFMDHDNVSLGKPGTSGRFDLSLYSSFTVRNGKPVLWYPDRKFFLLGRIIGDEWCAPAAEAPESGRPNIIVMLIDDLGYGDIGAFGCPDIPTPHIDSLARDGVRCLNGYTVCPVCSPSRAGVMTGLYPQRFRVNGNLNRGEPIPADRPTLAECLRDAGYATGMVGRWDLGDASQGPLERGFSEVAKRPSGAPRVKGSPTYIGKDGTYWTEVQGSELADFIERHQKDRFFLYFAPLAVHSPVEDVPAKYLERVPAGIQGPRRSLAGTLIALDDAVGKCLEQLRASDLNRQTLIFFVGDNGGQTKDEARNVPFRGGRATNWDGAVHEPYIVRWTGHLPAGTDFTGLVSTLDIYATAAAAAGVERPAGLDGVDITPFLAGQKIGDPHEALFWRWLDFPQDPLRAVRSGPWRLLLGQTHQLYNIAEDPGETKDMAAENPAMVAALNAMFARWEETLPAPIKDARRGAKPQSGPPSGRGWAK